MEQLKIENDELPEETPAAAENGEGGATAPGVPVLADMLFDRDRDLRLAAAVTLGRLREKNAGPVLAAARATRIFPCDRRCCRR